MGDFLNEIYDKIINIWKDFSGTNIEKDDSRKEYKHDVNYYESIEENKADNYINYYDFNDKESFKD